MRNPFRLGCLKPKTKDDDDSLLRYPGVGNSTGGGGGVSSAGNWQTPPLGKGAMRHIPPYQVQCTSSTLSFALAQCVAAQLCMTHGGWRLLRPAGILACSMPVDVADHSMVSNNWHIAANCLMTTDH